MTALKRTLSLPILVLYGLGTTIGAGIYALLGELAGVSGYMAPASFLVASFMAALTAASFAESVFIAASITVIEIGGLVLVIIVSHGSFAELPSRINEFMPSFDSASWGAIYSGSLLAFYAFIGFEDMVDVAEEVKDVKRNLPKAILLTLGITTLLYMVIMLAAVLTMPPRIGSQCYATCYFICTLHG